jgi:hypothetical protein
MSDDDARAITRRLQDRHVPFGLVFDAVYDPPDGDTLAHWDGLRDAALWTGCYLAAEAFHHAVAAAEGATEESEEAARHARYAVEGIRKLSLISGNGLLARFVYPVDGPFFEYFLKNQLGNAVPGSLDGQKYYYETLTTRDQFAGVFFGLATAYDLIDDDNLRQTIASIITRLTDYLVRHDWCIFRPNGKIRDTFLRHPDKRLSILQVARHVNCAAYGAKYEKMRRSRARWTWWPIWRESLDRYGHYYKFNVMALYLFDLLRLEDAGSKHLKHYTKAYARFRKTTRGDLNAHFNALDRALTGADDRRDRETMDLLDELLRRGFRSTPVTGNATACGKNRACDPIPVGDRPFSVSFVWQQSPFVISDPGNGSDDPGVSYLLPYWMMRYYSLGDRRCP